MTNGLVVALVAQPAEQRLAERCRTARPTLKGADFGQVSPSLGIKQDERHRQKIEV